MLTKWWTLDPIFYVEVLQNKRKPIRLLTRYNFGESQNVGNQQCSNVGTGWGSNQNMKVCVGEGLGWKE